jgi:hypothetical protein
MNGAAGSSLSIACRTRRCPDLRPLDLQEAIELRRRLRRRAAGGDGSRARNQSGVEDDRRVEVVPERLQILLIGSDRQQPALDVARRCQLVRAAADEDGAHRFPVDGSEQVQSAVERDVVDVAIERVAADRDRAAVGTGRAERRVCRIG